MSASAQFHANRMIDLSDKLLLGALPGPMGTGCILLLTARETLTQNLTGDNAFRFGRP